MTELEQVENVAVIPYAPRRVFERFHTSERRWSVIVAHRRAGKTTAAINKIIKEAVALKVKDGRYGYIAPFRAQAKEVAWKYLCDYSEGLWREPPNESELRVELLSGATIRLYGSDNPDALRGTYFDGVVLDEFASMREGVWTTIVRPMLSDRRGWACFIGTPFGGAGNAFTKLWRETAHNDNWYRLLIRADTSGCLSLDELDAMQEEMSPEEFDQEMLCSFEAAIKGAYYSEQIRRMDAEGRIGRVPIDRAMRVHTAWDLGRRDATAIWFIQCVGRERRLVDYYESSGAGFDHYAQVLHDKRRERGWIYGEHYFPHDVEVHMLDSRLSRIETLRALGIEATVVKQHAIMDGINAVRRMLDRTWVDEEHAGVGLEHLRLYRADWDQKLHVFMPHPRHDEHSHGADALRIFAAGYDDQRTSYADASYRRRLSGGRKDTPSAWSA